MVDLPTAKEILSDAEREMGADGSISPELVQRIRNVSGNMWYLQYTDNVASLRIDLWKENFIDGR